MKRLKLKIFVSWTEFQCFSAELSKASFNKGAKFTKDDTYSSCKQKCIHTE